MGVRCCDSRTKLSLGLNRATEGPYIHVSPMLAATLLVPPTRPGLLHLATEARSRLSSCQYSKRVTYWRDSIGALPKPNQSIQRCTVTNQRGPRMADPILNDSQCI